MIYLLDTICVDAMRAMAPQEIGISTITLAELEYGVVRAEPEQRIRRRLLLDMLQQHVFVAPFEAAAARSYAAIRSGDPQRSRKVLAKLIAAHALSLSAVLVTNNEADFRRIARRSITPPMSHSALPLLDIVQPLHDYGVHAYH